MLLAILAIVQEAVKIAVENPAVTAAVAGLTAAAFCKLLKSKKVTSKALASELKVPSKEIANARKFGIQNPEKVTLWTLAVQKLHLVAPTRDEAVVLERVTPTDPPAKSVVARR